MTDGLTLDERRVLLRQAVKTGAGVDAFRHALAGASEDERTSLARTLPPSRLLATEGPTARACYVLTALAKPVMAAEKLAADPLMRNVLNTRLRREPASSLVRPSRLSGVDERSEDHTRLRRESAADGARGRDDHWCYGFIDALADATLWTSHSRLSGVDERSEDHVWDLIRRLVRDRGLAPESPAYLNWFVKRATLDDTNANRPAHAIADFLRTDESYLRHEFWALFRVEGMGSNWLLTDRSHEVWNGALLILAAEVPGFRKRLLDESLGALLRDFSAKNTLWYHQIHRRLDPTPDETAAREATYLAVLCAAPSTSAALAQDMLKRAPGVDDVTGFLDASSAVLRRTEKKLVRAQIGMLNKLSKTDPGTVAKISELVSEVSDSLPLDLAAKARVLQDGLSARPLAPREGRPRVAGLTGTNEPPLAPREGRPIEGVDEPQRGAPSQPAVYRSTDRGSQAVEVIAPSTGDLPDLDERPPIAEQAEFLDLVRLHIEGTGDGADIPRLLAYVRAHPGDHMRAAAHTRLRRAPAPAREAEPIEGVDERSEEQTRLRREPANSLVWPSRLSGVDERSEEHTLAGRAREVLDSTWDPQNLSPRRHVAVLVLTWLGEHVVPVRFAGYQRHEYFFGGTPIPDDFQVEERSMTSHRVVDGREELIDTTNYRRGTKIVPTHSPDALFAVTMELACAAVKGTDLIRLPWQIRSKRPARADFVFTEPLPASSPTWQRIVAKPGGGTHGIDRVLGGDPKPFWIHTGMGLPAEAGFADWALDVADVAGEFTFRAQTARDQDGYDQLVQWAAWLYQHNLDTFAAHAHPMLWTATRVVNVRGVLPLLVALGQGRRVPGGPVLSALALGMSAKQADHRAAAAEAVAELAANGLLPPTQLAAELGVHMAEGFVLAGRAAGSLADAASIHPLAGYRVLQTLTELLQSGGLLAETRQHPQSARPHEPARGRSPQSGVSGDGSGKKPITGAAKLVELTARLAADYGTPVPIPQTLAHKVNGSSMMAVSLRALADVVPHETELGRAAAEQAESLKMAEG